MNSASSRALEIIREAGVARPRDLQPHGISRSTLQRMVERGLIHRLGYGLYTESVTNLGENISLVEVARRAPQSVVCLLSALRFHDIGTQNPWQVWIAIGPSAWRPRISYPPLQVMRFSGHALTEGVETHMLDGVPVRMYSPAKTIVDCFKFRNTVGLAVALEALHEAWRDRRVTMDDLWRYAEVDRMTRVMRPYLESVAA